MKKDSYLGQGIGRLFNVLAKFSFATSETEIDYNQQSATVRVASRAAYCCNL